jgi:uncharacterized repeat protein (TIGR01451 family)
VFSPDSTKLGFVSSANNLGPQDTDRFGLDPDERDIYVHDFITGVTTLVSVAATGTDSGNWWSEDLIFHPTDSTKVIFTSAASNLGPLDSNGTSTDIYLRDLAAGTTTLLSVNAAGLQAGARGSSSKPALSADGSTMAFESTALDLVDHPVTPAHNVYVRDLMTGVTSLVSVNAAGTDGGNAGSQDPAISPDGTMVAFGSFASDLGPEDPDLDADVYLRDLEHGTTLLVSAAADDRSDFPEFSPDGQKLAYLYGLAFLRRGADGTVQVVDAADTDHPAPRMEHPAFSPDSATVVFTTGEALVPRDNQGSHDVYVFDLASGRTELVSAAETQASNGNGDSGRRTGPVFSPDGNAIAYESEASNLDPPDTNGQAGEPQIFATYDVFVARYVDFPTTDVSVDVTPATRSANPGEIVTFLVTASNNGPVAAENVILLHAIPHGLQLSSFSVTSGSCTELQVATGSPVPIRCEVGLLDPGRRVELVVEATVTAPRGTELISGALVQHAPTLDSDPSNDLVRTEWSVATQNP